MWRTDDCALCGVCGARLIYLVWLLPLLDPRPSGRPITIYMYLIVTVKSQLPVMVVVLQ